MRTRSQGKNAWGDSCPGVYPHPIAFNVLPHVDAFLENGYTREEMKMQSEGRRIMHLPEFKASVTCVRVPVYRAHSVAVHAEFARKISVDEAHEVLAKAPGLDLIDEPQRNRYPMPLDAAGKITARSAVCDLFARSTTDSPSGFPAINYSRARR